MTMSIELAKKKVFAEVNRICKERMILESRLQELQKALYAEKEPVRGFSLRDIESVAATPTELYARIDAIKAALKKPFFDDPEFCQAALNYLKEIESSVTRLDTERKNLENYLENMKRSLEQAMKDAEMTRVKIDTELAELFEPLGETVFTDGGHVYTGGYVLRKLRRLAESC